VDWTTQPFMSSTDPKYRVRVLVPCYKEEVEVLRKTLTRAVRALHEGAACISEVQ
jgi:cellulose synthase/poly-beta-1,6-N-acetylglucosamine synthase-like glycosyltransferase